MYKNLLSSFLNLNLGIVYVDQKTLSERDLIHGMMISSWFSISWSASHWYFFLICLPYVTKYISHMQCFFPAPPPPSYYLSALFWYNNHTVRNYRWRWLTALMLATFSPMLADGLNFLGCGFYLFGVFLKSLFQTSKVLDVKWERDALEYSVQTICACLASRLFYLEQIFFKIYTFISFLGEG